MTPTLVDHSSKDYIAWQFSVVIHGMISFVIFYRTDAGIILESTIPYCLCPLLPPLFPPRRLLRLSDRLPALSSPLLVAHCRLLHPQIFHHLFVAALARPVVFVFGCLLQL